jgi:hypothetical protein
MSSTISLDTILTGKQLKPIRALIYGAIGVGKTHLAAQAPGVMFLDFEGGKAEFDAPSFPLYESDVTFEDGLQALRVIYENHKKLGIQTVCVDSIDWLQVKAWASICKEHNVDSIEKLPFGKGYQYSLSLFQRFMSGLDSLRALGLDIILLAHSQVVRVESPILDPYDTYTIQVDKRLRGYLLQWCDLVLFAEFETFTRKASEKFGQAVYKGTTTGKRIMHTQGQAGFEAKSRINIPTPLPLDWSVLKQEISKSREGE